jgi:Gpi18-like mannosyltransferase
MKTKNNLPITMKPIRSFSLQSIISRKTLWEVILFPFIATRFCWILVAYFVSNSYLPNPTYERYVDRGFFLTRIFPIDIFARWDSAGYYSIIKNGYQPSSDLTTIYSNIPFFPLYPYLVKSIGWLGFQVPDGFYIIFGVLLSNLFFLASLILLYKLITEDLGFSEVTAMRSIGLIFVFPTSFIFSSFYTESLFLFLSLAGFYLAFRDQWRWVAFISALLLLSRTQGVVVWAALILLFLEKKKLKFSKSHLELIWFLIAPIGLALHFFHLYNITGYVFAPFVAMTAWGRNNFSLLTNLQENLNGPGLDVFKLDAVFTMIFVFASLLLLWKWKFKSFGFLALILSLMPVSSGLLVSVSRYLLVVFPVFIFFGEKMKRMEVYDFVRIILFSLQIIYFAGWVNYYWIA